MHLYEYDTFAQDKTSTAWAAAWQELVLELCVRVLLLEQATDQLL